MQKNCAIITALKNRENKKKEAILWETKTIWQWLCIL